MRKILVQIMVYLISTLYENRFIFGKRYYPANINFSMLKIKISMYVVIFLNFFILYLSATSCTTSISSLGDSLNSFRPFFLIKLILIGSFSWAQAKKTSKEKMGVLCKSILVYFPWLTTYKLGSNWSYDLAKSNKKKLFETKSNELMHSLSWMEFTRTFIEKFKKHHSALD